MAEKYSMIDINVHVYTLYMYMCTIVHVHNHTCTQYMYMYMYMYDVYTIENDGFLFLCNTHVHCTYIHVYLSHFSNRVCFNTSGFCWHKFNNLFDQMHFLCFVVNNNY